MANQAPKPKDAIDFLTRKRVITPKNKENIGDKWEDISGAEHAHAFTAAHITNAQQLEAIRGLMVRSMEEGIPYDRFKADMLSMLEKEGWYLRPDKIGDAVYSDWRIGIMYQTNMLTSRSAGRYRQQLRSTRLRPFWVYKQIQRPTKRASHESLNNLALRWDDPFWDTYYPPNGWRCECYVETLSTRQYEDGEYQRDVTPTFNPESIKPEWRHNPGREVIAPDYTKFKHLANFNLSDGRTARRAIIDFYREEISTMKLGQGEWESKVMRLLQTRAAKVPDQQAGKGEVKDGLEWVNQAEGFKLYVANLDSTIADKLGTAEIKLLFEDNAIQHSFRSSKMAVNPEQILPASTVKRLPAMIGRPDHIYREIWKDKYANVHIDYIFTKAYEGPSQADVLGQRTRGDEPRVIKAVFRKLDASKAWELESYLIVRETNISDVPGITLLY